LKSQTCTRGSTRGRACMHACMHECRALHLSGAVRVTGGLQQSRDGLWQAATQAGASLRQLTP
jgi:hypothetical protein